MKISDIVVVIPVKNEGDNLEIVLGELRKTGLDKIVVGVDPSTNDNSVKLLSKSKIPFRLAIRSGYDAVVHTAIILARQKYPKIKYVLFSDAGGKVDLAIVSKLINEVNSGADLVLGVRSGGQGLLWHQKIGTLVVLSLINLFFSAKIADISPFRLIKIDLLEQLDMVPQKFSYPSQMLVKALAVGCKIAQVEVITKKRIGKSKVSGSLKNSILAGIDMFSSLRFVFWKLKNV